MFSSLIKFPIWSFKSYNDFAVLVFFLQRFLWLENSCIGIDYDTSCWIFSRSGMCIRNGFLFLHCASVLQIHILFIGYELLEQSILTFTEMIHPFISDIELLHGFTSSLLLWKWSKVCYIILLYCGFTRLFWFLSWSWGSMCIYT